MYKSKANRPLIFPCGCRAVASELLLVICCQRVHSPFLLWGLSYHHSLLHLIYRYPSKLGKRAEGTASHKHLRVAGWSLSPRTKNMLVIICDLRTISV